MNKSKQFKGMISNKMNLRNWVFKRRIAEPTHSQAAQNKRYETTIFTDNHKHYFSVYS